MDEADKKGKHSYSVDIAGAKDGKEAWGRFLLFNAAEPEMAKNEMRKYLRNKSKQQIKEGFSHLHPKVLEWCIEYLGLPTEDYEICQAMQEIISEHTKKTE